MFQSVRALICDGCLKNVRVAKPEPGEHTELPEGWRAVMLPGWVGVFHVCSDGCVQLLLDRVQPTVQ